MALTRRELVAGCGGLAAGLIAGRASAIAAAEAAHDVPWLAEVQTPPKAVPEGGPTLNDLLIDDAGRRITTPEDWEKRRAALRKVWADYLGLMPANPAPPKLTVVEEDRPDGVVRQLVTYEGEPGITVRGYLLKPAKPRGRVPGVVVMHSTVNYTIRQPAGLEGPPEKWFGLGLARRGRVAFCPECFLWHDKGERSYVQQVEQFHQRHPQSKGMAKMQFDAMRAVDVLCSLDVVDAERIGAVGHSLGAKEALYLGAFDGRVKATVSSEGGVGTTFSNWQDVWYLDQAIRQFGREQHEVLALHAPRPFLLIGGDSADGDRSWPFIERAAAVYGLYGRPARIGLLNHHKGHAVPPISEERIYEWLLTYV